MARLGPPMDVLRAGRTLRVALVTLLVLALGAAGWMWFRESSFVAAHGVQISGVEGPGATAIESALRERASGMSTLDVNVGALRQAVASYPQVRDLNVRTSFPHGMRISVVEQPVVAILQATDGARTAAAADGAVLGGSLASGSLPIVGIATLPAKRVKSPAILECLELLGAAPSPLVPFLSRAYDGPKGLTVALRNGLLVVFGNASRPHAKWLSFARVLVAEGGAGASYVDVRLPERPAVAGASGGASASDATSTTGDTGSAAQGSLGSSAALVAGLEATINGGEPGAQPASPSASGQSQGAPPEAPPSESQGGSEGTTGPAGTSAQEGESGAAGATPAGTPGG